MNKAEVLEKIQELGVLAVIRGPSADLTVRMVEALMEGGISGIEITYSTPGAEDVVRTLGAKFKARILVGMGTLTQVEQAESAKVAGASFLVSPVCEPELVRSMIASGLPTMAGALTPTEVLKAHKLGADVIKIFPGSLGGPSYVKALRGPFPQIPMMPTGGVDSASVADWFAAGVVAVGAGSELCPPQLARDGNFAEITKRAEEFARAVKAARASSK